MRSLALSIALIILAASAAPAVAAQQPAAQTAPPEMKTYSSAADVQALIAQKKAAPLLAAAPYSVNMEYRTTVGPAAVHEREAEIFYIIEGTGTLVTGGKLVNETRANPANLSGTAVEGGSSRTVSKGDFILVPEGTPPGSARLAETVPLSTCRFTFPAPFPLSPNWKS